MNSDEDKLYFIIIALNTIQNFVVEKFLIKKYLESQKKSSKFMDFEI